MSGPPPGPGVESASVEEVLEALDAFRPDAPWSQLAAAVVPMFERRRPLPPGPDDPLRVVLPPGVTVGFGVDIGPASVRVTDSLRRSWGVDLETLVSVALDNVRRRSQTPEAPQRVESTIAGVPVGAYQSGGGWASTLVLVPDALERVIGSRPRLITAPMRDLLLFFPPDVDLALALDWTEDIASRDPNALALEAFEWRDARLACRPMRTAIPV